MFDKCCWWSLTLLHHIWGWKYMVCDGGTIHWREIPQHPATLKQHDSQERTHLYRQRNYCNALGAAVRVCLSSACWDARLCLYCMSFDCWLDYISIPQWTALFWKSACQVRVFSSLPVCSCAHPCLAEEAVKLCKWLPASLGSLRQQICRSLLCQGRAETVLLLFNRKQCKVSGAGGVLLSWETCASHCVRLCF